MYLGNFKTLQITHELNHNRNEKILELNNTKNTI